jgi:hypothetical protein
MDDSLNIAMDYFIRTGKAVKFPEAQETAAQAIEVAWRSGVRNRVRLSWQFGTERRLLKGG